MHSIFKRSLVVLVISTAMLLMALLNVDWSQVKMLLPQSKRIMEMYHRAESPAFVSVQHRKPETPDRCNIRRKKYLNCRKLFEVATDTHSKKYRKFLPEIPEPFECTLDELVKDCPKLRSLHGYEDKPVSEGELKFPLAFAIKMHTNSHQVERLLRTIYRPHNFYCIHVDSKASDEMYDQMQKVARCLTNVVILPRRYNVIYASYRLVLVEFACMQLSMASGVNWKYYINLTGQEYMLKTNLEIVEILKLFNGINDIESQIFWIHWRHRFYYKIKNNKMTKTKTKLPPFKSDITIYKGSAYGMFSREFVDFILHDDVVKPIYDWLKNTFSPEECIWATLNLLPFAPGGYQGFYTTHDNNTHPSKSIHWRWDKPSVRCYGKYVRHICIFGIGDLPWLRSRYEVAANKFYEEDDPVVLDCLEEWLNNKTYSSSLEELDWEFYQNLPQVKYSRRLKPYQKTRKYLQTVKANWLKENTILFTD